MVLNFSLVGTKHRGRGGAAERRARGSPHRMVAVDATGRLPGARLRAPTTLLLRLQRRCLLRRQFPRSTGKMTAQRHHARCICHFANRITFGFSFKKNIWIFLVSVFEMI